VAAVSEMTLLPIDAAVRVVGALLLGGWLLRHLRPPARDPLDVPDAAPRGPGPLLVIAILLVFLALMVVAATILQALGVTPTAQTAVGAGGWHLARIAEDSVKLLVCLLMLATLRKLPAFPDPPRRGVEATARLTVGGVLVVMALAYCQLQGADVLWRWLYPDTPWPQHVVLEAVRHSAWGHWGLVQLVFSAVVVAPLAEELFFRGILLQGLWSVSGRAWVGVIGSAVFFGLIHMVQPQAVVPLATMGLVLGVVRVRYRSLWLCVLIHALFNARTMELVLLNPDLSDINW